MSALIGHIAAFLSNLFFGLSIPVTKELLSSWLDPIGYTLLRALSAAVIFWTASFFLPREKVAGRDLAIIAAGAFLGFIASQFLFALSMEETSPVNYAMVVALSPVIVLLRSAALHREKITAQKGLGVTLGVAGALVVVLGAGFGTGGRNNLLGLLYAFLSVAGYAVYLMISGAVAQKYRAATIMKWLFLFTSLMLLPFGFKAIPEEPLLNGGFFTQGALLFAYIVIFSTAIGYFLLPVALRKLQATTVSVYYNLQPIVASVSAIAAGQDSFSWDKPLAAALVISGAWIVTRARRP